MGLLNDVLAGQLRDPPHVIDPPNDEVMAPQDVPHWVSEIAAWFGTGLTVSDESATPMADPDVELKSRPPSTTSESLLPYREREGPAPVSSNPNTPVLMASEFRGVADKLKE